MKEFVHFTADWCQPCKRMEPEIVKFLEENTDVNYVKINIEKDPELFEEYSQLKEVKGVPTFLVTTNGVLTASHTGVATKDKLQELLTE